MMLNLITINSWDHVALCYILYPALIYLIVALLDARREKCRGGLSRGPPVIPCSWPWIRNTFDYLANPIQFILKNQKEYGDTFYAVIRGQWWVFVLDSDEIGFVLAQTMETVVLPEAQEFRISFFPRDVEYERAMKAWWQFWTSRTKYPSQMLPIMDPFSPFHRTLSLSFKDLKFWQPGLRSILSRAVKSMPHVGLVDLFDFCKHAIVKAFCVLVFGYKWAEDDVFLQNYTAFVEATGEDRGGLLRTTLGHAVYGERRIWRRVRASFREAIDEEIELILSDTRYCDGLPSSLLTKFVQNRFTNDFKTNKEWLRVSHKRFEHDILAFTFENVANTCTAAGWLLYHIVNNTDSLSEKLKVELLMETAPTDFGPSMQHAILEVSRLYSAKVATRKVVQPMMLNVDDNHEISPGTVLALPLFSMNRSGWEHPLTFDPSRFDPGRSAGNLFVGFGVGENTCQGKRLAFDLMAMLAREFMLRGDYELVPDEEKTSDSDIALIVDDPNHPDVRFPKIAGMLRPTRPVYFMTLT